MALSVALYFTIFKFAAGIHIHAPKNIATVTGNPVTMSCGTNTFPPILLWYFRSVAENKEILIYNGFQGSSRFAINEDDNGLYQIRIENVTTFDAGTYRCVVRMAESGGTRTVAEFKSDLIVLESHPKCKTNASSVDYQGRIGDILLLYCTVDYTGNWSPYMEWSRNDGINITTMSKVIHHNTSITSTLALRLNPGGNDVTFACKTAFSHSTEIETKTRVRNVPAYQFVWTFTANVLFGPQQIEITPNAEYYSSNDKLYCAADGNPTPSCIWIDLDANKEVAKGCVLIIDENMTRDQMHNYQCRAENAIDGVRTHKSTNVTFRIIDQTDIVTLHHYSIIGLVVGTAVSSILLSIIATSILTRMKRKCRENTGKERSTEVPSLPHEYESVSDTDIQMNQLEKGTDAANKNTDADGEEDSDEEEAELNNDTPPSQVNDAGNDSARETYSQLVTSSDYSSLMEKQPSQPQPTIYSQLGAQANILPVVPDREEGNNSDVESSVELNKPQTYYNIQ